VKPKVLKDYGNTVGSSIIVETTFLEIILMEEISFIEPRNDWLKGRLLIKLKATRQHF